MSTSHLTLGRLSDALESVRGQVRLRASTVESHLVTVVEGLEAPQAIADVATYLILAGVLQGIQTNLALTAAFLGKHAGPVEDLELELTRLLGPRSGPNAPANQDSCDPWTDFCNDQRNPWIAEGVAHLLLMLSEHHHSLSPPGKILALMPFHDHPKDRGVDLIGIHRESASHLGIHIGEAKASEKQISGHVSEATNQRGIFAEIDRSRRQMHIRRCISQISQGLAPEDKEQVVGSFWKERRAYIPLVVYGSQSTFNPQAKRSNLRKLLVDRDRIKLICVPLDDFRRYFDNVSSAMWGLLEAPKVD